MVRGLFFRNTGSLDNLNVEELPMPMPKADEVLVKVLAAAMLSSKIVKGAALKIYPGAPHGLGSTHKDQVNEELLAFLKAQV